MDIAHVCITLVRDQRDIVLDLGLIAHAQDPAVRSIGIMWRKTIINAVLPAAQPVLIRQIVNMKTPVFCHLGEVRKSDQTLEMSTEDNIPHAEV